MQQADDPPLLAWSWGTTIAGAYAAQNNDRVERLVLYAPVWQRQTPSLVRVEGPLGAYRTVTMGWRGSGG